MRTSLILASCLGSILLSGCGESDVERNVRSDGTSASADALPAPAGARGGVTGMPDAPGPGEIGPPEEGSLPPPAVSAYDSEGNPVAPDAAPTIEHGGIAEAQGPLPPDERAPYHADEPGPQEAAAVVRAYYGAINGGSMATAYRMWSNDGRASGQSPQQFADGFAQTAEVSVEIMQPGRIDAATGARYIEVPVAVAATQRDGSIRRYVGAYTLRRSVVDGASADQRTWRITSADIREVQQ